MSESHSQPGAPTRRAFLRRASAAALAISAAPSIGASCGVIDTQPWIGLSGSSDEDFMRVAIDLARRRDRLIPFSAVIVDTRKGVTVAAGVNETLVNPTDHGEVTAIADLMRRADVLEHLEAGLGRLRHLKLYSTGESCPMCMSAVIWCGFSELVYGSSIPYIAAKTPFPQIRMRATDVAAAGPYAVTVRGGVLESETNQLFRDAL